MTVPAPLAELRFPEPDSDTIAAGYAAIGADLDAGRRADALAAWDRDAATRSGVTKGCSASIT